jgi:4-amino-4-deoxy-L-arabinose transferase-like glycosyltransferase
MPQGARVAAAGQSAPRGGGDEASGWGAPLALALLAGAVYTIGLARAGFYDNEGRFVEMAREMLARGDWVTPHLNGVPMLTKPPLTQWLTAVAFELVGTSEWARIVVVLASMATLVATCRLGTALYDRATGLVAGALLATMIGFALEARTLRPDALLVASATWAMLCWHRAETAAPARRGRWLAGFWAALGVGILAKGLVPFVVVGPPVALWMLRRHGRRAIAELRPGLGLAILAVIVLPWHLAAAAANPGFAWDYVVNQHLLFAFDKKEPRDSVGDTLLFFWIALAFRTAPWGLLAPSTLRRALREASSPDPAAAPTTLLWAWVLGHTMLFTFTPSRLEHYTLPAHPALALLAAPVVVRLGRGDAARSERWWMLGVGALAAAAGLLLLLRGRALVSQAYWIPEVPDMLGLVPWAGAVLVLGGGWVVAAVVGGAGRGAGIGLLCVAAGMSAVCARALVIATPLFSWKPVAEAIRREGGAGDEIVFEAPVEYQLVGGLDFYLGRSVTLLEPVGGFVPPTYLVGRMKGMFLSRRAFAARWAEPRPLLLVSDPLVRRDEPDGIAPGPFRVVARFGDRWILANSAVAP